MTRELAHVFWIGGSPCAGKSSLTDSLAARFKLRAYHCDEMFEAHRQQATADRHPALHKLATMTCDEIWLCPVGDQVQRVIDIYTEEFAMICDDLRALPITPPIVAEGAALLPQLAFPLSQNRQRAIWIVPSASFQYEHYARRTWVAGVLRDCSDPAQAFRNWMARDAAFARWVIQQAQARDLCHVVVDGEQTLAENEALVANHFRLCD